MTTYAEGAVLPHVERAARELGERFHPKVIGGWRLDSLPGSYHPMGRALDLMVYSDRQLGDAIAAYAWANRARLGVIEVIWQQRIITTKRASEGWRAMSDRGSVTANHRDHVHLSFSATAGDSSASPDGKAPGGVLGNVGGAVVDAAGFGVGGLDAVGKFFAVLGERGTWVRVAQVIGGTGLLVTGVMIVGRSVVAGTAAEVVMSATPVGRVAGVVSTATKGATGAAAKAAKAAS